MASMSPNLCPLLYFLIIYFNIYFGGVLGLHCCPQAFSSCSKQGLLSSCSKQGLLSSCGTGASHCSGFSCCRAWALGCSSSAAVVQALSCPVACVNFLDQGSSPSPALAGGFLTTGPPGKSLIYFLYSG